MRPSVPGPHPAPHPPTAFTPPPLACDAHCHVFGPAVRFPFAPDRTYTPPDAGLEQFEALQRLLGLERAVFVQASCHGTDNSAMLDALRRGAGRYAGVAMVEATITDAELDEMHEAGVRGVRFNFVAHLGGPPDTDAFDHVIGRIAERGWHVVVHLDAEHLPTYRSLLDSLACPFIVDHMGRVDSAAGLDQEPFRVLLDLLADERAWVKISGAERVASDGSSPFQDVVPFARALVSRAPDRVLWGTDWPHPNVRVMPDDGDLIDFFATVVTDPAARQRILVDNPQRLYDFA